MFKRGILRTVSSSMLSNMAILPSFWLFGVAMSYYHVYFLVWLCLAIVFTLCYSCFLSLLLIFGMTMSYYYYYFLVRLCPVIIFTFWYGYVLPLFLPFGTTLPYYLSFVGMWFAPYHPWSAGRKLTVEHALARVSPISTTMQSTKYPSSITCTRTMIMISN